MNHLVIHGLNFPAWLQNRLISAVIKPVLGHSEKNHAAHQYVAVLLAQAFGPLGIAKQELVFILLSAEEAKG